MQCYNDIKAQQLLGLINSGPRKYPVPACTHDDTSGPFNVYHRGIFILQACIMH
jgi:hypothetical protein